MLNGQYFSGNPFSGTPIWEVLNLALQSSDASVGNASRCRCCLKSATSGQNSSVLFKATIKIQAFLLLNNALPVNMFLL